MYSCNASCPKAVLVAIAIPIFTGNRDKAALSADAANIRVAYAELMVHELDSTVSTSNATFKAQFGAVLTANSKAMIYNSYSVDLPAEANATITLTAGNSYTVTIVGGKINVAAAP